MTLAASFQESGNEKIAVVVAFLAAQRQRLAGIAAGGLEYFGMELVGEEFIRQSLIDQDRAGESRALDQLAGIVFLPRRIVVAEIALERLLPPRAAHRRCDGRERG